MKLRILEQRVPNDDLDSYVITYDMLIMSSTHLFISSNHWDIIEIAISDKIPDNTLSKLNLVTDKILVTLPDTITEKEMKQLTTLFPEKSGLIRRYFMSGQNLKEVLSECLA